MNTENRAFHTSIRRTATACLGILLGIVVILGILHYFYGEMRVEGIKWFNLDKERNLPTWFSGAILCLFGFAAIVAYYWERKINAAEGQPLFSLPILWVGVGLTGLALSLDEITILHENILWREIRLVTNEIGPAWIHVTQWQILLAPVIVLLLGYFVVFFSNRYSSSPSARRVAFAGIGCWLIALLLEGIRAVFKGMGGHWYSIAVLLEEVLEMAGAIYLLGSIVFYNIDIALDLTEERRNQLRLGSRFLTRRALVALVVTFLGLMVTGVIIFKAADKVAKSGASLPSLHKRAMKR